MIVDRTFFITCCKASRLFEPVDHPLHPFPCAVESPGKRPCVTLIPLPRNGDPDAVLPAIVPDLATAVALVAHNAVGPALGPPAPRPPESPLCHQGGLGGRVVLYGGEVVAVTASVVDLIVDVYL